MQIEDRLKWRLSHQMDYLKATRLHCQLILTLLKNEDKQMVPA